MGDNCDSMFGVVTFLPHGAGLNIFMGGPCANAWENNLAICFHRPHVTLTTDIILGETQGGDARTLYESVHSQVRLQVPMKQAGLSVLRLLKLPGGATWEQIFSLPTDTLLYPAHDYNGRMVSSLGGQSIAFCLLCLPITVCWCAG